MIKTISTYCEEANIHGMMNGKTGEPFPCGKKATRIMESEKDGREYAMCEMCASHNLTRGMVVARLIEQEPEQEISVISDNTSTALVIFETNHLVPAKLFTEEGATDFLKNMEDFVLSLDKDGSTEKSRAELTSLEYKLARTKTTIDKMGEKLKEDAQAIVNATNKERRRIKTRMEEFQAIIYKPVQEYKDRERIRISKHEDSLIVLTAKEFFEEEPDVNTLKNRISVVESVPVGEAWEEFQSRAIQAKEKVLLSLKLQLQKREEYEAEKAELERLRAKEEEEIRIFHVLYQEAHDQNVAFDARKEEEKKRLQQELKHKDEKEHAEKLLQLEKDRAENQRKRDHENAIKELEGFGEWSSLPAVDTLTDRLNRLQDKATQPWEEYYEQANQTYERVRSRIEEAIDQRRKKDAEHAENERTRLEKEAQEKALKIAKEESDRKALAEEKIRQDQIKREQDQEHKKRINNEALSVIQGIIDELSDQGKKGDDIAKQIIIWIASNKIPHVSIKY